MIQPTQPQSANPELFAALVTQDQINLVFDALGELPAKRVDNLLTNLRAQLANQSDVCRTISDGYQAAQAIVPAEAVDASDVTDAETAEVVPLKRRSKGA